MADKDKVLAVDAVGFADPKAVRPMTADAVFRTASVTKPMTAAAVTMLVGEGKVRLDDPVAKYLPEVKDLWAAAEKDDARVVLSRARRGVRDEHERRPGRGPVTVFVARHTGPAGGTRDARAAFRAAASEPFDRARKCPRAASRPARPLIALSPLRARRPVSRVAG